jgi:molecular chaperone GrpE
MTNSGLIQSFLQRFPPESDLVTGQQILAQFLVVLDSLDRCEALACAGPWPEYLQSLHEEMLAAFEQCGARLIHPLGQVFDPLKHEAVATQMIPGDPEGIIVQVITRGCEWRGNLLRAAQVVISRQSEMEA